LGISETGEVADIPRGFEEEGGRGESCKGAFPSQVAGSPLRAPESAKEATMAAEMRALSEGDASERHHRGQLKKQGTFKRTHSFQTA
jgi:hypothetical protein